MRDLNDQSSGINVEHLKEAYRRMQQSGKIGRREDSYFAFSSVHHIKHLDTSFNFHELDVNEGEDIEKFYDQLEAKKKRLVIQTTGEEGDDETEENTEMSPLQMEGIPTPFASSANTGKSKYDLDDEDDDQMEVEEGAEKVEDEGNDDWMNADDEV